MCQLGSEKCSSDSEAVASHEDDLSSLGDEGSAEGSKESVEFTLDFELTHIYTESVQAQRVTGKSRFRDRLVETCIILTWSNEGAVHLCGDFFVAYFSYSLARKVAVR